MDKRLNCRRGRSNLWRKGEEGEDRGGEKTQEYTTHDIANPAGTHFLHQTSL